MQVPCTCYCMRKLLYFKLKKCKFLLLVIWFFSWSMLDLPWLKCIYHHMSIIWSMIFPTVLLVYVDFRQRWKHRPTLCMKLRKKSHYLSSRLVGDFYVLLPFFQGFGLIMFSFPHNNVATGFLIPTIQFYIIGQY